MWHYFFINMFRFIIVMGVWHVIFNNVIDGNCAFTKYHNKRATTSVPHGAIDEVDVRGVAQCQLACQDYTGKCEGVNLVYSQQRAKFVCQLLTDLPTDIALKTDLDSVFMRRIGMYLHFIF